MRAEMGEHWISLPDAIARVASRIPDGDAIPYLLYLAEEARIGSRVALVADVGAGEPRRNVPISPADWRELTALETNWLRTGNAEWREGYTWLGIEIHAGDLALNLASLETESPGNASLDGKPKRRRPGPKPHPLWAEAVSTVADQATRAGYRKPLKRGEKAGIQTRLLNYMSEHGEHFSDDTAAKYAEAVIEQLPDN